MLEPKKLSGDLEAYVKKLAAQGHRMIVNSEQKQWHLVTELKQTQNELALAKAVAERKVQVVTFETTGPNTILQQKLRHLEERAQLLQSGFLSARAEADELQSQRLQYGLESGIPIEMMRGEEVDAEHIFRHEIETLRATARSREPLREECRGPDVRSA